jgi:hypothetical protein
MARWPTAGVRAALWADVGLWRASAAVTAWTATSTAQIAATPTTGSVAPQERADADQPDGIGPVVTVSVGSDGRMRPLFLPLSSLLFLFLKG